MFDLLTSSNSDLKLVSGAGPARTQQSAPRPLNWDPAQTHFFVVHVEIIGSPNKAVTVASSGAVLLGQAQLNNVCLLIFYPN